MIEGLPWFDLFSDEIRWAFHGLAGVLASVEKLITDLLTKEEEEVLRRLPKDDPEEAGYQLETFDRLRGKLMPRVFRYSSMTTLVTAIETTVANFVRFVENQPGQRPFTPTFGRRLYEDQWRYLEAVGITLKRLPFMERLGHLATVRNCIVHAAGVVKHYRDPDGVKAAVQYLPGFTLSSEGTIEVAAGALTPFVDEAREWLLDVSGMVNKHFRELYEATVH